MNLARVELTDEIEGKIFAGYDKEDAWNLIAQYMNAQKVL